MEGDKLIIKEHHTRIAGGLMRDLVRSIDIELGAPVDGSFGAVDDADPGPLEVDPDLREHYRTRYPPPDFSGWHR